MSSEAKEESYKCRCGGTITLDKWYDVWECDKCEFDWRRSPHPLIKDLKGE